MHYLTKTTTCTSASVFLSLIHATTVSMWPNGVYFQSQIFYCSRWTREMEQTFIDSLVEHSRSGLFHPDRLSIHAVMCSLYDVNKTYGTKVVYEWAQTRAERLRERYHLFHWVVNTEGIIWNARLGLVTGPDPVWQSLCQNEVIDANRFDLNVAAPQEGWVLRPPPRHIEAGDNAPNAEDVPVVVPDEAGAAEVAPHGPNNESVPDGLHAAQAPDAPQAEPAPDVVVNELAPGTPLQVMYQSDSSSESSSMWRHLHEYYGSDSDADSVLSPPGVPLWKRAKYSHHSPASQKSDRASSSAASNPTPVQKKD
ncbi:hypothetical protein Salat_1892000 [Sesamum alatum]|uniref:Myb/SANT-like domain-containing protein n=1 Tax=Sesamum alatum TaxID=300844 RepID=A0AAE2CID2_9LAMI|nr:hypothetical protein Salat_1892000 [Sesamum alatum]